MNATKQLTSTAYNMTPKEKRTFFRSSAPTRRRPRSGRRRPLRRDPEAEEHPLHPERRSTLQSQIANINQSLDYASRDRRTQITVAYASVGRETIGGIQRDAEGTSATRPGWDGSASVAPS